MKKKIAFITIHIGINVGSNLQAIATSEVLKEAGHSPVLINYIPERVTYHRFWKDARKSFKMFLFSCIDIFRVVYLKRTFAHYQRRYCDITKPIYAKDHFLERVPKADVYLTGSDQVWNFKHNEGYDGHYFFDGIEGVKMSYASSIGMDTLSNEEATFIKTALAGYHKLSVREDKAKLILEELGLDSIHLIDPTLMLNREQWSKFMSKRIVKAPYVLVYVPYNISDIEQIYKTVSKVAKHHNLKIVTFSWAYRPIKYADKTVFFASPGDFLSLMYYAEYVVTNSFHGTAFSINLNKQFWVYAPSKFSSRVSSIIKLLDLSNRMIDKEISDDAINDLIDYKKVNELLDVERKKAMSFLKSI